MKILEIRAVIPYGPPNGPWSGPRVYGVVHGSTDWRRHCYADRRLDLDCNFLATLVLVAVSSDVDASN